MTDRTTTKTISDQARWKALADLKEIHQGEYVFLRDGYAAELRSEQADANA